MEGKEISKTLEWIYARLKNHYNENPNLDYMINFQEVIEICKKEFD